MRRTAVLRQITNPGTWQARFAVRSDEADTLWFDIDGDNPDSNSHGIDALSLNLEDGAFGLYFEWAMPTPAGQPVLMIAEATLVGWCCAGHWPGENGCRE